MNIGPSFTSNLAAHGSPANIALSDDARRVTYAELEDRSTALARVLSGHLPLGARVGWLSRSRSEFFELLLACAKAGVVLVPLNWRGSANEVAAVVDDAAVEAVVASTEMARSFAPVLDARPRSTLRVIVDDDQVPGWTRLSDVLSPAPSGMSTPAGHGGDAVLQIYTSGTTGSPKGVMISDDNLRDATTRATGRFGIGADAVLLAAMPQFHVSGAVFPLASLLSGATMFVTADATPPAILDRIDSERVTVTLLVPALIGMILRDPTMARADTSSLSLLVYGGAPITEALLAQALETLHCRFMGVYGMTEATGPMTALLPDDHGHPELLRSVGRPFPDVELRIVAPDGRDAPRGSPGEVWSRAPQNMLGYWNRPEETSDVMTPDGWLRTGDGGYVDDDGYLFLTDRIKDMIITGGENVFPAEVENVLAGHPTIAEVAVIGVPDEKWGEAVAAVIVARGPVPDAAELGTFCRERLAHYKCPSRFTVLTDLPRNATGKVLKHRLRSVAAEMPWL